MADFTYRSQQAVTLQTRGAAYDFLCDLLRHLDALNLNLRSVTLRVDNFVDVVVFPNPLPVGQVDHLHLTGPV